MAEEPLVTVIVPVLNEESTIREVITRLLALPLAVQVIVVDDASTDRTPEILREFAGRIHVLHNEAKSGKGAAIRQSLPFATGKVVVIQDADLEYSPEELPSLVQPILAGHYAVVYGNRFHHGYPRGMALPNKVVNWLLSRTVGWLFGHRISDEATCYKAFRKDILDAMELQCTRFEFCPETTAKTLRMGEHIHEVPIQYQPRTKEAGKKIRWTDAPDAFLTLWKYRRWRP